ncbi:hypothetical protein C8R47DRAFT_1164359 [Mycena vitilis]|nr:hypothetical protein C8R47DRAFT_1164359 [Mycena vitilis]
MFAARCFGCDLALSVLKEAAIHAASVPAARLHTLLNGNEPPEESELPLVQSLVSQNDARSAILDEEITKLRETLRQLEQDRASLLSYRVILSPLRRMPPEVLSQIFLWTLPSLSEEWRRNRLDAPDSPWNLTRVSGLWRAVSLSTPSLWSGFAIHYAPTHDPLPYPLAMVNAQIQRSGSQKLNIHFYGCERVASRPQIQIFQLLSEHSERWEELAIGITAEMAPLLNAMYDRLPSLRRLWIDCTGSAHSQTDVLSVDFSQTASSLVDVGIYNENRFVSVALPAHRLTRYQLDGPWATHDSILRMAHNLIEARVMIHFDQQPWPHSPDTIELMHLRRLYVSDWEFLDHIESPSLQKLALWIEEDDYAHGPECLETFFNRAKRQLCSLVLKGTPDAETICTILQKNPSITSLFVTIDNPNARTQVNALMSSLAVVPGRTVVAPHLRSISFGYEGGADIDLTLFLEMLGSRWKAPTCALTIAALAMESPEEPHSESVAAALQGLRELRRARLDLLLLEGTEAMRETSDWICATSWIL